MKNIWRPLAIMLAGAIFVWSGAMYIHSARADEADTPKAPWAVHVTVTSNDGEQHLDAGWYQYSREKGVAKFATKAACEKFQKTDKEYAQRMAIVRFYSTQLRPPGTPTMACEVLDTSI